MTREQYIKITDPLRKNAEKAKMVVRINSLLTGLVFLIYPFYLAVLYGGKNPMFVRAVFVPAMSFVLVSVLRNVLNVKRPYEKFEIPSVIKKDTRGKSFPSRHVFSAFVIATTVFYSCPALGIFLGGIGTVMAVIRVAGGVHTPVDVIAGAVIGILCGVAGYSIL